MKKIDSLSIIINFDGYSQRAEKEMSKIESDVETVVRYAKNRRRYEKNVKKYAKNLGLRAMLYCGRPLKSLRRCLCQDQKTLRFTFFSGFDYVVVLGGMVAASTGIGHRMFNEFLDVIAFFTYLKLF